jgi:uncharacterized protein YbjT (DUF2867 family)
VDAPTNLRLLRAAGEEGVGSFLYVSVLASPTVAGNDFVRGHEAVVEALRQSTLRTIVLRPTGFFSSLVRIMREPSWGLLPQANSGRARTNPIHEADLAAFCADLLEHPNGAGEHAVGGPETLTRREIAELVLGSHGCRRPPVRVPAGVLRLGGAAAAPLNRRVSQLLFFIAGVLSDDFVAPSYGTRTLSAFVEEERACG